MTVSTIILAPLRGGGGGGGKPGVKPSEEPGDQKGIIKNTLERLAGFLGKVGVAALLPGIVGTILNCLLKTAGAAVGFFTEFTIR